MRISKAHKLPNSELKEYYPVQTDDDIDKLAEPLEGKATGESALWLMSAYHHSLAKDSSTTFGDVKGVFIDEQQGIAGFIFEDQDMGERFRVTISRDA